MWEGVTADVGASSRHDPVQRQPADLREGRVSWLSGEPVSVGLRPVCGNEGLGFWPFLRYIWSDIATT